MLQRFAKSDVQSVSRTVQSGKRKGVLIGMALGFAGGTSPGRGGCGRWRTDWLSGREGRSKAAGSVYRSLELCVLGREKLEVTRLYVETDLPFSTERKGVHFSLSF